MIAIVFIIMLAIATFFVYFAVKVRQEIEHLEKILRMADEKNWREKEDTTNVPESEPTPVHSKPQSPLAGVATAALETAKKVQEIAEAKKKDTQSVLEFAVEPEAHRPRDPNKPKRKSPRPHNRVNNKDEFWHEIIREYFTMKKKNPTLTRADFVRIKDDPRIKAKTFNSKLHYMSKYGALPHKTTK